jgi:hypothetical protein
MPREPLTRDRPIVKGRIALLIVDVQNGTAWQFKVSCFPNGSALDRVYDAF